MYAVFSGIFGLFISPLNWILALILMSLLFKNPKRKKRALIAAFIVLIIFSNKFLLEIYAKAWDIKPVPLEKGKTYSTAIVLGGFSNEALDKDGLFNDHADRLIEVMRLKATGKVSYILISAGNEYPNDGFTEAAFVRKALREMNFPDSVILSEDRSTNTVTNAKFSKLVIGAKRLKPPYILVTSSYHMRRSMYIFKENGMDVIPYSSDYIAGSDKLLFKDYFVPNSGILNDWDYYIKEFFGLIVAHIKAT